MSQTFDFTVTSASQSEQSYGYWLIELAVEGDLPLSQALGSLFFIASYPELKLAYFQAKPKGSAHQFLSLQPLPKILLNASFRLSMSFGGFTKLSLQNTNNKPLWLVGSDLCMANVFAYAQAYKGNQNIRVLLHSANQFPFIIKPARFLMSSAPAEAIGASTLLEDWGVPNRLASNQHLVGTWQGSLAEFLAHNLTLYSQHTSPQEPHALLVFANTEQSQACYDISQQYPWLQWQDQPN